MFHAGSVTTPNACVKISVIPGLILIPNVAFYIFQQSIADYKEQLEEMR